MCDHQEQMLRKTEEEKIVEEKKEEVKAQEAQLPLGTYMEFSYDPQHIDDERLERIKGKTKLAEEQAMAEKLKLELQQQRQPQGTREIRRPNNAPPVAEFDAYVNLSARKRKKLEDRRNDNLKKAQKKGFPGASEDTLPMMNEVKKYNKKKKREGATQVPDSQEASRTSINKNVFSPIPYTEKCDTTFNVNSLRYSIDYLNTAITQFRQNSNEHPQEIHARFFALERICETMTEALKTVMAANGVNYLTGNPVTPEEQELAQANKDAAIRTYRETVENRDDIAFEEYERLMQEPMQIWYDEFLEDQTKTYKVESENLPFTFSTAVTANDYRDLRKAFNENPDNYLAHKDIIDKIYLEYLDICKIQSERNRMLLALTEKLRGRDSDPLKKRLKEKSNPQQQNFILEDRRFNLEAIMHHLLSGRPLQNKDMPIILEREFGYVTEERLKRKAELFAVSQREYDEIQEQRTKIEAASSPQELTPVGTEYTVPLALDVYDRLNDLIPSLEYYETKLKEWQKEPTNKNVYIDVRIMRDMLLGYRRDRDGNPVTLEDERKRERDMKIVDDYLSNNRDLRKPWLDEIVESVTDVDYREEMLEPGYLSEHFGEMIVLANRILIIDNLISENKEYFKSNPEKMLKINALGKMAATFSQAVINFGFLNGIDAKAGKLDQIIKNHANRENAQREVLLFTQLYETFQQEFNANTALFREKKERLAIIRNAPVQNRVNEVDGTKIIPFTEAQKARMKNSGGVRTDNTTKVQISSATENLFAEVSELFAGLDTAGFDYKKASEGTKKVLFGHIKIPYSPEITAVMTRYYEMLNHYLDNADFAKQFATVYENTIQLTEDANGLFKTFESRESKVLSDCLSQNMLPISQFISAEMQKTESNRDKIEFLNSLKAAIFYSEKLFKEGGSDLPPEAAVMLQRYTAVREKFLAVCRENTPPDVIQTVKNRLEEVPPQEPTQS